MALQTRRDQYAYTTGVNAKELHRTSHLIEHVTGIGVQPNKAIVGANAFAHESGIHQDGVLKDRQTYEIMRPQDVGVPESALVLGKHSGRAAFRDRLRKLGYTLADADLERAFARFKDLADRKKQIADADLDAIVGEGRQQTDEGPLRLVSFQVVTGSGTNPIATVTIAEAGGATAAGVGPSGSTVAPTDVTRAEAATGDGPVDALYRAFDRAARFRGHLVHYALKAVTDGKDALGEVVVRVKAGGRMATGRGASTDVLEASIRAYAAAVNKLRRDGDGDAAEDDVRENLG
jgi:2-isopropylmalate synthase